MAKVTIVNEGIQLNREAPEEYKEQIREVIKNGEG